MLIGEVFGGAQLNSVVCVVKNQDDVIVRPKLQLTNNKRIREFRSIVSIDQKGQSAMCGIFGAVSLKNGSINRQLDFENGLARLGHRGPDFQKVTRVNDKVLFGHTRLSILDLSEGSNQPMAVGGRYWITYNGEIFNFLELRSQLEAKGVNFYTTGDTEVLLQAYIAWGPECVLRFNGMWAFAIYDKYEDTLFCSRDRYGEKPFNYVVEDDELIFASEIKAIISYRPDLIDVDYNAISNYCRTSVGAQNPQSWFRNVRRLPPGHNLTVYKGRISVERYWHYPAQIDRRITYGEANEHYAWLFRDAVRIRMRSDVEIGLTLSSGIDSSSIAFAMNAIDPAEHHCFTAIFSNEDRLRAGSDIYKHQTDIDELSTASDIAKQLGYKSHSVETNFDDFISELGRVIYFLESGHSSSAVIPLMQLYGEARKFVKVVMDGQGADELLGGYVLNTVIPSVVDLCARGNFVEAFQALRNFGRSYNIGYALKMLLRNYSNDFNFITDLQQDIYGINRIFGPRLREYKREKDFLDLPRGAIRDSLGAILLRQHSGGLINLLHYGDALSMANGIETRMPFMDFRLVEFVWGLPSEFKVQNGVGKALHRQAMRGVVPDYVLDQNVKYGFNTPISDLFRNKTEIFEILFDRKCVERDIFDVKGLSDLIKMHRSGRRDHSGLLFRVLSTEMWFRRFVDQPI